MTSSYIKRGAIFALLASSVTVSVLAQDARAPVGPPLASPAPAGGPGSLAGTWVNAEYKFTGLPPRQRTIKRSDGQDPPLLPAAQKLLDKRVADAEKGNVFANTLSRCLPGGVPQMDFGAAYPIQIIETPGQVTILYDEQNHFRIIPLGTKHAADPDPSYMGDSVGRWDGDTLVVDTIALKDTTTIDMVGTPHGEKLHVVERFKRIAADRIEVRVTIDDPDNFQQPWEARTTWKPATDPMTEYICENNRNAPDESGFTGFAPPPPSKK